MESWQGANLAFWLITAMVLVSACFAALSRDIIRAAYNLFFTLFGMAGYYVLLGSGFLAVTQVIIYVGGILVLIMFGILLTNRSAEGERSEHGRQWLALATGGAMLLLVLGPVIARAPWMQGEVTTRPESSVLPLGQALLTTYLPALVVAGMTLLLCLIGAAYLVRREER